MKKKVVILTSYFCGWNGGIDLICYFLKAINYKKNNFIFYIFIPKRNLKSNFKKFFFPFLQVIKYISSLNNNLNFEWKYKKGSNAIEKYVINNINMKNIKIIYTDFLDEKKNIKKIKPDIIFPVLNDDYESNKGIGYIFDLQHEYLPDNFSKLIINHRRRQIENLSKLNFFLVNSKKTKNDIIKFHKTYQKKKIMIVPFTPNIQKKFLIQNIDISNFYNSSKNYFITCNGLWKHKNHIMLLDAFKQYLKKNGKYNLILTGDSNNVKDRSYIKKIRLRLKDSIFKDRVFYLGNINKKYQVQLLKNSIALIQPSLFEGGPGAGAVNEAIAIDLPVIVSDIEIHKEIKHNKIFYFNTKNQLIKKLFYLESKKLKKLKIEKQILKMDKNFKNCNDFFVKSFNQFLKLS